MSDNQAINQELEAFRDTVLHQRGALAENGMTPQQINDVLSEFDHTMSVIEAIKPDTIKCVNGIELKTALGGTIALFSIENTDEIFIKFTNVSDEVTPLRLSKDAANCLMALLIHSRGVFQ